MECRKGSNSRISRSIAGRNGTERKEDHAWCMHAPSELGASRPVIHPKPIRAMRSRVQSRARSKPSVNRSR